MNCEPDRVSEHPHRPRLMRSLDRPLDEPLRELHRCIVYEIPQTMCVPPNPLTLVMVMKSQARCCRPPTPRARAPSASLSAVHETGYLARSRHAYIP